MVEKPETVVSKPDFIFIGPHKSGTTWIDNYLRYRGDVLLPSLTKETFFFDKLYDRGPLWYEAQFGDKRPSHRICVEVAPSLLDKPEAAKRVARDLPDVTVICTLRNPIDRAVSHYFHHLKGGEPDMGFHAMAAKYPELLSNGLYYKHLKMWIELLGRDKVKTICYDLLNQDPGEYCRQICAVLGIPVEVPPEEVLRARVNEDGVPPIRLLAMVARRTAETLRVLGAHNIVNFIRKPSVLRLIYGAQPEGEVRARVRNEALDFYAEFLADFQHLDTLLGIDTSAWRVCSESQMSFQEHEWGAHL